MITHVNGQLKIKSTNYTKQNTLTKTLSLLNEMIKALDLDINISFYEYYNDVDSLRYMYPQLLPKNYKNIKYHLKIESNKTVKSTLDEITTYLLEHDYANILSENDIYFETKHYIFDDLLSRDETHGLYQFDDVFYKHTITHFKKDTVETDMIESKVYPVTKKLLIELNILEESDFYETQDIHTNQNLIQYILAETEFDTIDDFIKTHQVYITNDYVLVDDYFVFVKK
mgnify:CR=1 FL=1